MSDERRTALVTGASRGIGKAIAASLADAGAFVIGTATSETGAAGIGARLRERGAGLVVDVGDTESVDDEAKAADLTETKADDACPVSPRSILEAMLFVGHPDNEPLKRQEAAALIRGVEPAEIDDLVCELNTTYDEQDAPYTIASDGPGYRLCAGRTESAC